MATNPKQKVHTFKYQKLPDFRTVQIHGAYGGVNIKGQLNINFYVESAEFPRVTTAPINGSSLGPEIFPQTGESISAREVPFGINIDIPTARVIIKWMGDQIDEFESRVKQIQEQNQKSLSN